MDIILYNIFVPIICLIIGYCFGIVSFSILIGKIFYHQDPRDYGSHNPGATNAGRIWGKKVGFLITCLDMFKTVIPMWACWAILTFVPMHNGLPLCVPTNIYYTGDISPYVIQWPVYLLCNLGCFLGHCFPIQYRFKGGKGVSCFMGTSLLSSWGLFIPGATYFLVLKKTKHVSTSSIYISIVYTAVTWIWAILCMTHVIPSGWEWFFMYGPTINPSWHYALIITIMAIILIIRHRENIQRLREGTERKIKWMK